MNIRGRASAARSRARAGRPWRTFRPVVARSVYVVDQDGAPILERRPDLPVHGRSTIKLLTALAARQFLPLDRIVTVTADDTSPNSVVAAGQNLTVAELLVACMEHSDNTATLALAREAGMARIKDVMQTAAPADWVITDPRGFGSDNRVTARGMVDLLLRVAAQDEWLHRAAARNTHGIPGYLAGKTGTDGHEPTAEAHIVWSWARPDGTVATGAVMGTDERNRPLDVAAVQRIVG